MEKLEELRDITEGFSLQARIANRIWIVLATLVIAGLQSPINGKKTLPFGFGSFDPAVLDISLFFIVFAVFFSFLSHMSQVFNIHNKAHEFIDKHPEDKEELLFFYNSNTHPTIWRVSPLSAKQQSFLLNNRERRRLYYPIARSISGFIMIGLPVFGLVITGRGFLLCNDSIDLPITVLIFIMVVGWSAAVTLIIGLVNFLQLFKQQMKKGMERIK